MKITKTKLKDCLILEPLVYEDDRGCFFESYNEKSLELVLGYKTNFVQDNESESVYGVIRGLHIQEKEYGQAKLVRVIKGKVLDVAVDVRKGSDTYGQFIAVELSSENKKQLFIPRGFLHGFSVLSKKATFFYKCDNYYNKESENGINPLDPYLNIDWRLPTESILLSDKDKKAQYFQEYQ